MGRALPKGLWDIYLYQERRIIMAQIGWITSFDEGMRKAGAEGKLVFLDFFNPN